MPFLKHSLCWVHFRSLLWSVCGRAEISLEGRSPPGDMHRFKQTYSSSPVLLTSTPTVSYICIIWNPALFLLPFPSASKHPLQLQRTELARPYHEPGLTTYSSSYACDGCSGRQKSSFYTIYHHCLVWGMFMWATRVMEHTTETHETCKTKATRKQISSTVLQPGLYSLPTQREVKRPCS